MKVCDENHEEIVFEGGWNDKCPICKLIKDKDAEIKNLENKISTLEDNIDSYLDEINELKEGK